MTVRTDSVVMLTIAGLTGLVFAATRGFWPAAPLLVIAAAGLFFHVMPPVPREQPGRVWWANANMAALILTLGATWYESLPAFIAGAVLIVITLAVPRRHHTT